MRGGGPDIRPPLMVEELHASQVGMLPKGGCDAGHGSCQVPGRHGMGIFRMLWWYRMIPGRDGMLLMVLDVLSG
jgi:hypothetical protein